MFKNILVPTDGSPLSNAAVHAAVKFAKENGSRLVGISVSQPYPLEPLPEDTGVDSARIYEGRMNELAHLYLQELADAARGAGVPCETVVARSFDPYEEIIRAAEKHGCDVIFMASHGRKGLSRLFLGSQTQKVLAHSTIPVLVFRQQ